MRGLRLLWLAAVIAAPLDAQRSPDGTASPRVPELIAPTRCDACAAWNEPTRPFRIHGNTWYVGTRGLSALLVTSPTGHVLIDAALPESAPLIAASIRALGFRLEDVKLILNSHAHYDHAGGLAALQRATGATVALHPWSARVVRLGATLEDDPQFGLYVPFPGVRDVREIRDGEVLRVGELALTAHFTGGHTPGGTTWTWRSCDSAGDCADVVYADSQTPIGDDSFRFASNARYPTVLADFARGHARIEALDCDVLITPHPGLVALFDRAAKHAAGDAGAFREPNACRSYVATARQRLADRLSQERSRP